MTPGGGTTGPTGQIIPRRPHPQGVGPARPSLTGPGITPSDYQVPNRRVRPVLEGVLPMCRTHWATMASAVAAGLLMAGMSACSDSSNPSGATTLTVSETNDIGDAIADEVDQAVGSITTEGAGFSVAGSQAAAAFFGIDPQLLGVEPSEKQPSSQPHRLNPARNPIK